MTYTSEKFCIKTNDFQQNIVLSYQDLRKESDFYDVTLVCEESKQIEAHQIVLNACSPFLSNVLKRNRHSHPIIYIMGLKVKNMVAMMDFIYLGETSMCEEDLDGFLAIAKKLQIKGLAGSERNTLGDKEKDTDAVRLQKCKLPREEIRSFEENPVFSEDDKKSAIAVDDFMTGLDYGSMMIKINEGEFKCVQCTVCGKTTKGKDATRDLKRHIETHIDGLSYPCNNCGKFSRTSRGLLHHKSKYHKASPMS